MQTAKTLVIARFALVAVIAAALAATLALPTSARAEVAADAETEAAPLPTVALVTVRRAGDLEPLREGYAEWLRMRLRASGLDVRSGRAVRSALEPPKDGSLLPRHTALARAKQWSSRNLVLAELRPGVRDVELVLSVYDVASGGLRGAGRARGAADQLPAMADDALRDVLHLLGGRPQPPTSESIAIDELAAWTRSLRRADRGSASAAWRELEGFSSSGSVALRSTIQGSLKSPAAPATERARVLADLGQPEAAWRLIGKAAKRELRSSSPDPALLVAAGEVEMARGRAAAARPYFDRVLEFRPDHAEALMGQARVLVELGDHEAAKLAYARVVQVDSDSPAALHELAWLERDGPMVRAGHLMEAGARSSRRLDVDAARKQLDTARRLDRGLEGPAREQVGDLELRLRNPVDAIAAYRDAASAASSEDRVLGIARAHRALGETDAAAEQYQRVLEMGDDDFVPLLELAVMYEENDRADQAVVYLEQAVQLRPDHVGAQRELGLALHATGRDARALQLLEETEAQGRGSAEGLQALAVIRRAQGDEAGALVALERALDIDPTSGALRRELANSYEASGDAALAQRHNTIALSLADEEPTEVVAEQEVEALDDSAPLARRFALMIDTFAAGGEIAGGVALLGLRDTHDWKQAALHWLHPETLDVARLEDELELAIGAVHHVVPAPETDAYTGPLIEDAFAFQEGRSLSAGSIASLNSGLGTSALYVARLSRLPAPDESGACDAGALQIEVRELRGALAEEASALSSRACLPGALQTYATWNWRAAAVYLAVLFLIVRPVVRGWGRVAVSVKLPPKTKALFSVSISKRERKLGKMKAPSHGSASGRIERGLQSLNRFERPLGPHNRNSFTMIPARRKEYYVTLRGPLLHYVSDELVGNFLESKTVKVVKGRTAEIEFDLAPEEAAIQVVVTREGEACATARVALRGKPDTLRYAPDGSTFLYVPRGEHVLVVSDGDRVSERVLHVNSFDAQVVEMELEREENQVFAGCPEAVVPYMEGDLSAAADVLEQAGRTEIANEVRAEWVRQTTGKKGVRKAATRPQAIESEPAAERPATQPAISMDDAGDDDVELPEADIEALLEAQSIDMTTSATIFEEAGDWADAAEAHRAAGDLPAAARAYEQAYDYDNAIECYREMNDTEKLLELLEKTAEFFEAGRIAWEHQQADRAIHSLQQVESRHPKYSEVCRLLAEILIHKGELDFAIEKYQESFEVGGGIEMCPIELHMRYAQLLEQAHREEEALAAYEDLRRRDLNFRDVNTRIESLRKNLSQIDEVEEREVNVEAPTIATPRGPAKSLESRYEILEELGRGGMGVVYKAKDKHLGRIVALKQLTENLKDHPTAVQFFEREARSAAALNHPNIVTVFDAGQENGTYFMTMEFLEGTPLDHILKKHGPVKPGIVMRLGQQISAGLGYAHRNKIIHRDIKTANLLFTKDKVVKIMDFGLAKMVEEVRRSATVIGGTPYFMAPEQADGEGVDHRADLYALGVTFFNLLTGGVPFGKGDVTYHHKHSQPPDPRELDANIPAPLAKLILKLLQKDPAQRIQTADEVGALLQRMIEVLSKRS